MTDEQWVEICARDQAWAKAEEYFYVNGTHEFVDPLLARCIEGGKTKYMTPECWTKLKNQYPLTN